MKVVCFIVAALISMSQPFTCMAMERQSEQSSDLALEVFQMTQSFDELVHLLKSQGEQEAELQKLQIAVTYLSFRSRNIESKRNELQKKTRVRNYTEESIAKIKDDPEQWEKFEKSYLPSNQVQPPKDFSLSEYRLKMLKDRLDSLDSEIIALETEVQGMVDDLAVYETYVQKKLNLVN